MFILKLCTHFKWTIMSSYNFLSINQHAFSEMNLQTHAHAHRKIEHALISFFLEKFMLNYWSRSWSILNKYKTNITNRQPKNHTQLLCVWLGLFFLLSHNFQLHTYSQLVIWNMITLFMIEHVSNLWLHKRAKCAFALCLCSWLFICWGRAIFIRFEVEIWHS